MSKRQITLFLAVIYSLYAAWGAVYIYRTSFMVSGTRIYTLWDDAMVSMRYAANLQAGHGLLWNAGEAPIQGITNLGLTLIMAAVHWLPVGPYRISLAVQILNLLALLLIIGLVWKTCADLFPDRPGIAVGAVLGTALNAPLGIWGLQGADTTLVAFWLMVTVSALARSSRVESPYPHWLWGWIALGSVIRLDCAIFSFVFLLGSWFHPEHSTRRSLLGSAVTLLVLGAQLTFAFLYYGDPLPNTYYLKSTGTPVIPMLISGLRQVISWTWLPFSVGIACYSAYRYRARPLMLQMAAIVVAIVLYTIKIGGDWATSNGIRFIVPVLPLLLILIASGVFSFYGTEKSPSGNTRRRAWLLVLTLLFGVLLNPLAAAREWFNPSVATMYRGSNSQNARIAIYFKNETDPRTRIALYWAGLISYLNERPVVDLLGKTDRHIAHMEVDQFFPGHSKYDYDYTLREQRPDIFVRANRGLGERSDFRASYYRVRNRIGDRFYIRKDAIHLLKDPQIQFLDMVTGAVSAPAQPIRK